MTKIKTELCINCAKRKTCKSENELNKMESNLMQYMKAKLLYGYDPNIAIQKLLETHKHELICENYIKE